MATNTGKPSEAVFVDRLGELGIHAERIFDAGALRGLNKRAIADFPRPADFLLFTPRGIRLAEVKSSSNATSFPFGNIERGQRKAATLTARAGAGSWAYLFFLHNLTTHGWHIMTADTFVETIKDGRQSIKWADVPLWETHNAFA